MVVYRITNILNGKVYIGQTVQIVTKRWRNHCKPSNTGCSAIHSAIMKYGIENFKFEIIEYCNDINELNKREEYWIDSENTLSPHGYNLRTGGENSLHSEETKIKQSLVKMGELNPMFGKSAHTFMTEEEIAKKNKNISLAKKGVKNTKVADAIRGRTKENFEYLYRMAEKKKLQTKGELNPNSKTVCVGGVLYTTMKEASVKTGISMYKLRRYYINEAA